MARILVIEDSEDISDMLKRMLRRDGHEVKIYSDGSLLDGKACRDADLILLDVMMPVEDGYSVCGRIREEVDCPILFLTAKDREEDVLKGLAIGGDDYIVKPFSLPQLRARIEAHLRREQRTPVKRLRSGDCCFDLAGKELYVGENRVRLTKSEFALAEQLAGHPGLVYTREQLLESAFGYETESDEAAVTEHVKNLRAKLAAYGITPVETVWGIGYKWNEKKALVC